FCADVPGVGLTTDDKTFRRAIEGISRIPDVNVAWKRGIAIRLAQPQRRGTCCLAALRGVQRVGHAQQLGSTHINEVVTTPLIDRDFQKFGAVAPGDGVKVADKRITLTYDKARKNYRPTGSYSSSPRPTFGCRLLLPSGSG